MLLHHLFFRSRVALLDPHTNPADPPSPDGPSGSDPDDEDVQRLLRGAGITALPPSQQPSLVFRVAHGADARFTQAARCHGTRLGFHGSPPGNVFSIVALGLRNLSNSRGMLNGAAFGEGVYVASHLSVAREFSSWGTKVWRHSTFGAVPPQTDPKTAAPVFAYQIIACCEFVALDKYTKRLVPAPPSSSSSSSSGASRQQQQRQQQQQQQGGGGGRGAKAKSEYYVIEEAEQHLVVRLLLLFKDPAIGRQGGASPARATGPQTSTNPRVSAATAAAAAATAGGGGRGRHPQRRRRGWDSLLVVVRVVSSLFAILLLLDGLEQLLTRSGFLKHPALPRGGGGKRRTVQ